MKRLLFLLVACTCCLLAASFASAANVSLEASGIVRGSTAFTFSYDPADRNVTVVSGVRPNDLVSITYGVSPSGLDEKFELFMKDQLEDEWNYDVLGGEKWQVLVLGEPVSLDVDGDGTDDLVLVFQSVSEKRGTLTFTPVSVYGGNVSGERSLSVNENGGGEGGEDGVEDSSSSSSAEPSYDPTPSPPETPSNKSALPLTSPGRVVERKGFSHWFFIVLFGAIALIGVLWWLAKVGAEIGSYRP